MKRRFVFFIAHIYLAFVHAIIPAEGEKFFKDMCNGRNRRKKREWAEKVLQMDVRHND